MKCYNVSSLSYVTGGKMTLYIVVELSRHELPLFVGTRDEVAAWAELTPENVSAYCKSGRENLKNNCRFEKIKVDSTEIQ